MRSIIIDDNQIFCEYFRKLILDYIKEMDMSMNIDIANDLEQTIYSTIPYDVYFIDIEMTQLSGFEVIQKLKKCYVNAEFVIVSAYDEYMQQAFYFKPSAFIRKGELETDTKKTLDYLKCNMTKKKKAVFIQQGKKYIEIHPEDLMYCYSKEQYVYFIFNEKEKIIIRTKIAVIEEQLHPYGFVRIHRSIIVNLKFVHKVKKKDVCLLNGETLSISRRLQNNVNAMLMNWFSMQNL